MLGNKNSSNGIGLEPSILLDERSDFLYHLQELRRVNTGDDRSDMPGYGLYLVRMPVSILPGPNSIKGKGAKVTIQAKHQLTPDLLASTFRNVVILDTAYQLMDAVTRGQYLPLGDGETCDCETDLSKLTVPCPHKQTATGHVSQHTHDPVQRVSTDDAIDLQGNPAKSTHQNHTFASSALNPGGGNTPTSHGPAHPQRLLLLSASLISESSSAPSSWIKSLGIATTRA